MKSNLKRMLSLLLVFVMTLSMVPTSALAATTTQEYYVANFDSGGNDMTGDGTETKPFMTLQKALEQSMTDDKFPEIILKSDISLSQEFVFANYVDAGYTVLIKSETGKQHSIKFIGTSPIGNDSGMLKVTDRVSVGFTDVVLENATSGVTARMLYIDGASVQMSGSSALKNGKVEPTSSTSGGGAAFVANGGQLSIGGSTVISGNKSTFGGGAIYVQNGGSLSVTGAVRFTGNTAANGGAIYAEANTTGEVVIGDEVFMGSNTASSNGGAMYLEVGANASISGTVTINANTATSKTNNVYLPGDLEGGTSISTLDISGATKNASIGITCENPYYYKLVSLPYNSYSIDPLNDELGWSYDDNTYDIRYMVRGGQPGLYLCYHSYDMLFSDVTTLTNIEGMNINEETVDFMDGSVPACSISGGTLTAAGMLLIGDGKDLTVTIKCDPDEYRIPTEDIITVTSGGNDVPFTVSNRDVDAGTLDITIAAAVKDALTGNLVFGVSAEKYYTLTVTMEGPLYTMESTKTELNETVLDVSTSVNGTELTYSVTTDKAGVAEPVASIPVMLYNAATKAFVATKVTDADGKAKFDIDAGTNYYAILNYSRTYRVITRDVVNFTLSTLTGQTLADTLASCVPAATTTYDASTGKASISGIAADTTAVFRIKENDDIITFVGNEGDATTAPATINPASKQMEASASTYGALATASLVGYTFTGWYDAAVSGNQILASTPYDASTSAKTLYAHWVANTDTAYAIKHWVEKVDGVNVGFIDGTTETKTVGGKTYYLYETTNHADGVSDSVKDITNLDLKTMSDATVTWWTRDGFTAGFDSACKVLANGSSVFNIYYDRNTYVISFDEASLSKGSAVATETVDDMNAKFGAYVGTMPTPTLVGYDFDGWYTAAENVTPSEKVTSTFVYNRTTNMKLYAHWTAQTTTKYKAIIIIQGIQQDATTGKWSPSNSWMEYKSVSMDSYGFPLSSTTDTVKTFDVTDATLPLSVPGFTYAGYSDSRVLTSPTYTTDADHPTYAKVSVLAAGNGTVYLYYTRNTKVVEYPSDDPANPYGPGGEITFGGTFEGQLPPDPNRPGYDFTGWVDPDGNTVDKNTPADDYILDDNGTVIVSPTWKARKYTLTYIPGTGNTFVPTAGHTGMPVPGVAGGWSDGTQVTYDEYVGVMPSAKRVGYTFTQWELADGTVISPLTKVDITNVIIENPPLNTYEDTRPLYAKYTPHVYHLALNPGESPVTHEPGTVSPTTVDVTFDSAIVGLPIPELRGYTFVNWYFMVGDSAVTIKNGDVWTYPMTNGATVQVYAAYVPNDYRYTFDLNDDADSPYYGSTVGALTNPAVSGTTETFDSVYHGIFEVEAIRPGYNFKGWSLTPAGTPLTADQLNGISSDTTVYAVWEPKLYDVKMELKGGSYGSWAFPLMSHDAENDTLTVKVKFDTVMTPNLPTLTKSRANFIGFDVTAPGWPAPTIHNTTITALPSYTDYVDDSITLTAKYDYVMRFDPDGGKFDDDTTDPKDKTQSEIKIDGKLPEVSKDDYKFDGWVDPANPDHIVTIDEVLAKDEPVDYVPKYSAYVTFDANGGKVNGADKAALALSTLTALPGASRSGYSLTGWFTDATNGTKVTLASLIAANVPTTVYAHWTVNTPSGGGGFSGGGGSVSYTITVTGDAHAVANPDGKVKVSAGDDKTIKIGATEGYTVSQVFVDGKDVGAPSEYTFKSVSANHTLDVVTVESHTIRLLRTDHVAYIVGYDDGLVHQEGNLTRAEMTIILYRLLTDEARAQYETSVCSYTDVPADAWYRTAVATMTNIGIVNGVGGNKFAPNASITRAEMVTMMARFVEETYTGDVDLMDDIADSWARNSINLAIQKGWIVGYEDGKFHPNANLTRGEAMTIINRMCNRTKVTEKSFCEGMVTFPDNRDTSTWYYLTVQEATNGHNFTRDKDGYENWLSIMK